MKLYFFLLAAITLAINSFGQLEKNSWLVGGNGSYQITKIEDREPFTYNNGTAKELNLSPNIGYFIIDKLCLGLKPSFRIYKSFKTLGGSNAYWFDLGPFIRYYFLDKEKQINILTELSTQFGVFNDLKVKTSTTSILSALVGIETFFNSSCGMEILMGYQSSKEKFDNGIKKKSGLQFKIGFQLHLIK